MPIVIQRQIAERFQLGGVAVPQPRIRSHDGTDKTISHEDIAPLDLRFKPAIDDLQRRKCRVLFIAAEHGSERLAQAIVRFAHEPTPLHKGQCTAVLLSHAYPRSVGVKALEDSAVSLPLLRLTHYLADWEEPYMRVPAPGSSGAYVMTIDRSRIVAVESL